MKWLVRIVAVCCVLSGVLRVISFIGHGGPHTGDFSFGRQIDYTLDLALAALPVWAGVDLWRRRAWAWWYTVLITGLIAALMAVAMAKVQRDMVARVVQDPWALVLFSAPFAFIVLVVDSILAWRREGDFTVWGFACDPMHQRGLNRAVRNE